MGDFYRPEELQLIYEERAKGIQNSEFFRRPRYKGLQEMWCAVEFGLGYQKYVGKCSISVDLQQNSDADFILKNDAGEFSFQTTIADAPERRMGDDYKPLPNGDFRPQCYRPQRGKIEGPKWIAHAVAEKVNKRYSTARSLNLLVYANFVKDDLDYETVCDLIKEHEHEFASIWVITNYQISSVVSNPLLGSIPELVEIHNRWPSGVSE